MNGDRVRIGWVDATRGVAVLLVVLYHAIQWLGRVDLASPGWLYVNELVATLRMPAFFAAAGIFAWVWLERPWARLLTAKVLLFTWLYGVWQVITTLFFLVVPNVATPGKSNSREILTALGTPLWPQTSLWFLWALAIYFVIGKATRSLDRRIQLLAASAVSVASFAGWVEIGNVGWDGLLQHYVFFVVGTQYRDQMFALAAKVSGYRALMLIGGWAGGWMLLDRLGVTDVPGVAVAYRLVGVAAGVALGVLLQRVTAARGIGRHTLQIYLPHYFLVAGAAAALGPVIDPDVPWAPLVPPVVAAAVAATAWCLYLATRRCGAAGYLYGTPRWLGDRALRLAR